MVSLKIVFAASFLLLYPIKGFSQLFLNGNFGLGSVNWGCNPEIGSESTYGGTGLNSVAEVDGSNSLCQAIVGFIPGNTYYVAIQASRRTGGCPSPAVTNVDVSIGSLTTTITRTNTVFGWTQSAFLFTANNVIETLSFSPGTGLGATTCGMIIDNLIVASSALPVELTGFYGEIKNNVIQLTWNTGSEKNNYYFELERSENGVDFKKITELGSKAKNGNSSSNLNYQVIDQEPYSGTAYYRLKQVDLDGTFIYSGTIIVEYEKPQSEFTIYPNPGTAPFKINMSGLKNKQMINLSIYNELGVIEYSSAIESNGADTFGINPDHQLSPGCYNFCISVGGIKSHKKVLVF